MIELNSVAPMPVTWDRKRNISTYDYSFEDWKNKVLEEMNEVDAELQNGFRLGALKELCDVVTVVRSYMHCLGYNQDMINNAQLKINYKNMQRLKNLGKYKDVSVCQYEK